MKRLILPLLLLAATPAFAQKLTVKVINRQDNDRSYSYLVAGHGTAIGQSFDLTGATLTLQLPDGRLAVVNCKGISKSSVMHVRDCRLPMGDVLTVEFHGDNAKLFWNVSLDGTKIQSETYKIISVLNDKAQPK